MFHMKLLMIPKPLRRQLLAMLPAYLIMIAGGMFLAFGVFPVFIGRQTWLFGRSSLAVFFIPACFHIAVIVGAVVTSLIYNTVKISKIHFASSILMLVASVILITLPQSYTGVVTSRSIFGLGFGAAQIAFIIYGSEISSPKVRAQMIFLLHFCLTLGMFIFSGLSLLSNSALVMTLIGAFSASFTLLSIALGYFKLKSSHIFMMQNNLKDAFERFQYFQQDNTANPHVESEAIQSYIIMERERDFKFFSFHNVSALLIIILVELGYLCIFNALHNFYRAVFLSVYLTVWDTNYTLITLMAARLLGCGTGFFVLDRISKRLQYFISSVIISILLLVFGTLLLVYRNMHIWTPMLFFIPLEFMLGIGLTPIADILKGELFPLKEKPVSIATTFVVSEAIHIVSFILLYTWVLYLGSVPSFLPFIFGGVLLVCSLGVVFFLRDSRKQTLRMVSNLYSD